MARSDLLVTDDARPRGPSRRRVLRYAVGGVVLAAGSHAIIVGATAPDYRTARGERRMITLPDGSTADLAEASDLSVRYDPGLRLIVLHRGRASFHATPFPGRPFVVEAEGVLTETVGGRFEVGIAREAVTVTVAQGTVTTAGTELAAGRLLHYGAAGTGPIQDSTPLD